MQWNSVNVLPRRPGPAFLVSIMAVANSMPATRPKATPGSEVCSPAALRSGSTMSAMPHTATATPTMSMRSRGVRSSQGATSATHTGDMYSSEMPTATLLRRMARKKHSTSAATTKPMKNSKRSCPERRTSAGPPVARNTTASTMPASAMRSTSRMPAGMVDSCSSAPDVPRMSDAVAISA